MASSQNTSAALPTEFADQILEELNSAEFRKFLPALVYLIVIAVCGTIGNGIVCLVYRTRCQQSVSLRFILILAIIDLLTCCLVIPLDIAIHAQNINLKQIWLCKIVRSADRIATLSSSCMLLLICVDRFRKVCQPLKRQITPSVANALSLTSPMLGALCSCPLLVIYGKRRFNIEQYNITGTKCAINDSFSSSVYPLIDRCILIAINMIVIFVMCVLYCCVGRTIYNLAKRSPKGQHPPITRSDKPPLKMKSLESKERAGSMGYSVETAEEVPKKSSVEECAVDEKHRPESSSKQRPGNMETRNNPDQARANRTTVVMLLITVSYILSYLPERVLVMILHLNPVFMDSLSENEKAVCNLFLHSNFFSCAMNPIIYGLCDPRFRSAFRGTFSY